MTDEVRAGMERYLVENRQSRHARHQYRLGEYGLDPEREWTRFKAYTERFGVEREAG